MAPVNYRVSQPETVTASLRRLFELARSQGRLSLVVAAARYMIDELAYDLMRFGESRTYRSAAHLWERLAFAAPLQVRFAVHEESKQVFILELSMK